jgi:hypothetical protein
VDLSLDNLGIIPRKWLKQGVLSGSAECRANC